MAGFDKSLDKELFAESVDFEKLYKLKKTQ